MNLGRTVFAQLVSFLLDREFRRCVSRYDGDRRWRGFSCWDQFLSMAFAQLTYRESLRDIEACLRSLGAYRDGFDFLIVSDASAPLEIETRTSRAPLRLLDIATDQVRSLRARALISHLQRNPGTGVYLKIGNTEERIYRAVNRPAMAERIADDSLLASQVREAASISTTLRRFTQHEYDLLFAHGHQVADATLSAYCSGRFERWACTTEQ